MVPPPRRAVTLWKCVAAQRVPDQMTISHRVVAAGVTCVAALAACAVQAVSLDRALRDAEGKGEFPKLTSVLVLEDGKTTYEGYFGGTDAETLQDTRSATKSVTSLAAGIAVAEGKIRSVSSPAFAFLADLKPFAHDGERKSAITVEDLLTMSSALDCDDNDDQSPGNEENMYPKQVWARWAVDLPVKANYARDAAGRGPFAYCTAGVFLLGQIIQRAGGMRIDRYVEEKLFKPLGIARWQWPTSPSGEVMTGGGLRLRSRDLAAIARMLLHGGKWQGKQVVPESWVNAALAVHRKANESQDYGYLFWRRDYSTRCGRFSGWYMAGNGGNAILVFKDLNAAVVVTRANYNTRGMHQQTVRLLEEYVLPDLGCRPH
jgi:CubicO group peptidase (beta-lactamase class C family)